MADRWHCTGCGLSAGVGPATPTIDPRYALASCSVCDGRRVVTDEARATAAAAVNAAEKARREAARRG